MIFPTFTITREAYVIMHRFLSTYLHLHPSNRTTFLKLPVEEDLLYLHLHEAIVNYVPV